MRYLFKIAPYNLTEKFSLLKFTIGSRMINKVPQGLKYSYLLTNRLLAKGIKIKRVDDCIEFDYRINQTKSKIQLKRKSSDSQVFEQIIELEEYLSVLEKFKEKNISPQTMIDAGANIGLTSVFFKAFFPNISIIALEPSDDTFKRLTININNNNFNKFSLLKKGLWSSPKRLKADQSFRDGQDWSFRLVEVSANEPALFEATSIDEIIAENNLTTIDFL
jgi:FkbM family methyltransferase